MTKGYIYIMTNPAFPQYVKIGYADDVSERLKVLNSNSGLPLPYEVFATYSVHNRLTDKTLHRLIDMINPNLRLTKNREFFEVSAEEAYGWLKAIADISDTEDRLSLNNANDDINEPIKKIDINKKYSKFLINNEEFTYESAVQVFVELCEYIIKNKGSAYFVNKFNSNDRMCNRRTFNITRSSDEKHVLSNGIEINKHGSGTALLYDAETLCSLCDGISLQLVQEVKE